MHIANLDHEQPHGPPFFALPPASSMYHAHFLRLLASSTGAVGAMHFGSLDKFEEFNAAKKTIADENATQTEREEASALVATLERQMKERLSAQGMILFSCLSPSVTFLLLLPDFPVAVTV